MTRRPDDFSNRHSAYDDGWMRVATLADHANPDYPWGRAGAEHRAAGLDPAPPHILNRREKRSGSTR